MREITLLDLLKNGVHFGHQKSHRHPKMEPNIFTVRNGVHIINLEKTLEKLIEALEFIRKTAQEGGQLLFLGTKRQAKEIIKKHAQSCGMPYLTERWLGGLFTNFTNVSRLQKKLKKFEEEKQSGELEKYTKKERSKFEKEIEKLDRLVGGIKEMHSLPNAIFVVDIREEKTAIREASKKNVPIVAMVDTNTNPDPINYVIPANDDATKSIEFITGLVAEAVNEGKMQVKQNHSEDKKSKEATVKS
ncbi:MAG: 30S ribosomal protein S2 [Candidatus Kerfeldbacteria bacterium CG08_land_8_20_14_0_20_40_16]|uniref:Small ribosomal subunit protein uS2 n=1 Tax=Candidatus Kerfeldbacteria bacterium CG08_land_8_20_14_0_20_40_16 TaxID=2014244 RepID=A0A2H0YWV6_9BACT|nr:MAG: 30S ribosomal protein S2 [Candidatus Kerfeldbacteria bacterium CG08_land_8_20_14_0_20_40_16]